MLSTPIFLSVGGPDVVFIPPGRLLSGWHVSRRVYDALILGCDRQWSGGGKAA
jgi:hypothetical protein